MVRLCMLGPLRIEVDGADVELASLSRKARLLLAMLGLERRVHGRSELAGRLWPDVREDSARVSLRTALSQLRAALGPAAALVLQAELDRSVALASGVVTDVEEVERLLAAGESMAALDRCSSELLAGLDDDWVLERRDELRGRLARGVEASAAAAEQAGDLQRAAELTRRMAMLDPLAETPHRELIRRLAAVGDRGAALAAFDRFRGRLAQELRIAPSAATRSLVEEIRAEREAPVGAIGLPPIAPPGARSPLVGRGCELDALQTEWQRVLRGERRVVALAGEPGIGKTRLAAELCGAAHAGGALVLAGRSYEDALIPYEPFVEALRRYAAECPDQALRDQIGSHAAALAALVPELAERLGSGIAAAQEVSAACLVEAIVAFLRAAAGSRAAIVLLEDLHWAEHATAVALRHLLRGTEGARLLVLITYRDTEISAEHPLVGALAEARRARVLAELTLRGLDEQSVGAIVATEAGGEAPGELVAAVHARTAGNPFFVEEVVREAVSLESERLVVPQSVRDLLARRLRGMRPSELRLVETAAVIGGDFDLQMLGAAANCSEAEIVDGLDAASKTRAIVESGAPGIYSFSHALVRETVYERLTAVRRAHLHRQVGEALECRNSGDDGARAAALAWHFSAAGDHARAFRYHLAAAQAAARVDAIDAGLEHYDAAFAKAGGLDPAVDVDRLIRRLAFERGCLLLRAGRKMEGITRIEQALAAVHAAGDAEAELDALIDSYEALRGCAADRLLAPLEAALALADRLAPGRPRWRL